jgi:transcriptional regulator with XRE-family HTH domain
MSPDELKKLRKDAGLTQTELAERLGMSLRGVQELETRPGAIRPIHELALKGLSLTAASSSEGPMAKHIEDLCEDRAREGDGAFAIAYALLKLARAGEKTAKALEQLGSGDATGEFGAVEGLGVKIVEAAEIIAGQRDNE